MAVNDATSLPGNNHFYHMIFPFIKPFHKFSNMTVTRYITLFTAVSRSFVSHVIRSIMTSHKAQRFRAIFARNFLKIHNFWPDCKAIPAYGLMMSVCPSVCRSVNIWLTSAFKFVLGHINQYRLYTLLGNRP